MDIRGLSALGYGGENFGMPSQGGLQGMFGGGLGSLPQPITDGNNYTPNRYNAPIFSAGGLAHTLNTPYIGQAGVVNPSTQPSQGHVNPGSIDPGLAATLGAGGAGWMARGANAFLGEGFNPWGMEYSSEGGYTPSAQSGNQIDQLFNTAQALGLDTSGYTRDPGRMGIRGERSGTNDAMALYDALNQHTKDYVSVGGLSQGWSGGPANTASQTIYREQNGQLVPVSRPSFRGNNPDNGFFSNEFKDMASTIGSAMLGGYMAAPAAGAGAAGGAAGGAASSAGAAGGLGGQAANALGLGSQWASLPGWGQQALSGALRGGIQSAIGGGNALQGALTGGITGGAGSVAQGALGGMGLPSWASQGLNGMFRGGLGAALQGGDVTQGLLGGGLSGAGSAVAGGFDPRLRGMGGAMGGFLASLGRR